ncbi:MAG TPA: aminoglycoside phosphotransferase family protein [Nitrolancea sp.]|nr:aminoglycoside phosphotransferase family protein [Nitrolancea sp.]
MIAQPNVTPQMMADLLAALYGSPVTGITPIGAGAWSLAYRFEAEGVAHVIRWSQFPDNFERDAYATRYANDDLPIPPILSLGTAHGSYYAVSPFIDGNILEALTPEDFDATIPSLLRLLRALRRVDLSTTRGFGFWDGQGQAPFPTWHAFVLDDKNDAPGSLINGWRTKLETSPLDTADYDTLRTTLTTVMASVPEIRGLVHSDLLNRNVLAIPGRITGLLDWGSSFYGDPLYDIAWFVFYEPWYRHFGAIELAQRLLDDYLDDPCADQRAIDARLLSCLLDIGINSLAYLAFIEDWTGYAGIARYTRSLVG